MNLSHLNSSYREETISNRSMYVIIIQIKSTGSKCGKASFGNDIETTAYATVIGGIVSQERIDHNRPVLSPVFRKAPCLLCYGIQLGCSESRPKRCQSLQFEEESSQPSKKGLLSKGLRPIQHHSQILQCQLLQQRAKPLQRTTNDWDVFNFDAVGSGTVNSTGLTAGITQG